MEQEKELRWETLTNTHISQCLSCYNSTDLSQWSAKDIEDSLATPCVTGWALYGNISAASLLGFILFQQVDDEVDILSLAVPPSNRGRGYGALLLRRLFESKKKLFLEVAANNKSALRLYEKEGFIKTGLRPLYYKQGNLWVDAVTMTWSFTEETASN